MMHTWDVLVLLQNATDDEGAMLIERAAIDAGFWWKCPTPECNMVMSTGKLGDLAEASCQRCGAQRESTEAAHSAPSTSCVTSTDGVPHVPQEECNPGLGVQGHAMTPPKSDLERAWSLCYRARHKAKDRFEVVELHAEAMQIMDRLYRAQAQLLREYIGETQRKWQLQ